jgi:peroxiredoxin
MESNEQSEVDRMIAERFSAFRADVNWKPNLQRGLGILNQRRAASQHARRRSMALVAGAAIVCLPIMALPVTRAFASRCVSACVQETAVVRQALLGGAGAPSATYVNHGDRRMAPDFALTDASGRNIRLSDMRGKVVLLNFWATWCQPCQREIPWFVEFQRSNESRGFTVLGVSMDDGGWNAVNPFLQVKQVNYPVVIGNDRVAGLYGGLQALPLTLIIDRAGRIAAVHEGLCKRDEYERDISALLNEGASR